MEFLVNWEIAQSIFDVIISMFCVVVYMKVYLAQRSASAREVTVPNETSALRKSSILEGNFEEIGSALTSVDV